MSKPSILIKDEINCQLINYSPDVIHYFNKKFEYDVPSARFNTKYVLGIWDGKISFFNKLGETYIQLLSEIIPDLIEIGQVPQIIDSRINKEILLDTIDKDFFNHIIHPDTSEPLILRDYQVIAINLLINNRGGILLSSTGSGKTNMTAALCKLYNDIGIRCLVIVPSTSLVNQTWKTLNSCGLDVGRMGGGNKEPNHKTVVSTWQTLQNIPSFVTDFEMLAVDECHSAAANVIQSLISGAGKNIKYRYGLTGTMPKDLIDLINIKNVLGEVIHKITARTLIDAGYLANLHIDIMQLDEDFTSQYERFISANPRSKMKYNSFRDKYFPDYTAEKSYLKTNEKRLDHLANLIIEKSKNGNIFAIIDGIQFGKSLEKIIKSKLDKEHIHFISGKDKVKNRQIVYDLFADNDDVIVLATAQVAAVGLDIPRIHCLFLIDIGKSFIRTIQSIGRGLRKALGKDFVEVIDICSNLKYSKRHMSERIKFYNEAEYPNSKKKIKY